MVEHIPVVPHSRREARRAAQRASVRSRLAGIGGVGVALGITAAVVVGPMASADTAPAKVAVIASPVKAQTIAAVTAPVVEVDLNVSVPTITKNEPPPAPKPKVKSYNGSKKAKTYSETQAVADHHKDCGDKSWKKDKN